MTPNGRAQTGAALPVVLATLLALAGCAAVVPTVVLVAADDCDPLAGTAGDVADAAIPADYLAWYRQAAGDYDLPWSVLAAIGQVETRHGTLDAPGVTSGANPAGAAGPMQFGIGGRAGNTWGGQPVRAVPPERVYGVDGNGDGIADVYDPADAIPAAAGYLVANGAHDDLRAALFAYNRADWYVDRVLDQALVYATGSTDIVPAGCPDPLGLLGPGDGPGAWGGHDNGRIPLDELCSIGGGHRLRCDAAAAYLAMDAAYQAEVGEAIRVTDAYRDLAAQQRLHRRIPHLAATPGRSNHGWALALDMAVGGFDGRLFRWLQANAGRYGWRHPAWARPDGSRPEAWHWEYRR